MAEYNTAGAMTRRYAHNVGADVPLLSYEGATLGRASYLHADHQGSIVAVSDPWGTGSINNYDEYGMPGVANVGRFRYTGPIWFAELGMYYYTKPASIRRRSAGSCRPIRWSTRISSTSTPTLETIRSMRRILPAVR